MDQGLNISRIPCIPENFEPLFKLGLCYDVKKMTDESIKCFQKCIRIKSDRKVWQCLGQAYFKRGSYVNACKCLMKACQLRSAEDNCYFEELLSGEIKFLLGVSEEAESLYDNVIKHDAHNVVALIGMAKIKLFAANEKFESKNLDEAKQLVSEVFELVEKIVALHPITVIPYNLIANCCVMSALHMQDVSSIDLGGKTFTKTDLLQLARTHLLKAMSLKDCQYLWYNLFIVYALLFKETQDNEYMKKALFCAEK